MVSIKEKCLRELGCTYVYPCGDAHPNSARCMFRKDGALVDTFIKVIDKSEPLFWLQNKREDRDDSGAQFQTGIDEINCFLRDVLSYHDRAHESRGGSDVCSEKSSSQLAPTVQDIGTLMDLVANLYGDSAMKNENENGIRALPGSLEQTAECFHSENSNLVDLCHFVETDENIYLVFPFMKYSLQDVLTINHHILHSEVPTGEISTVSDLKKKFVIYQLVQAINCVHSKGIFVPRLEPRKVLVTENMWLQLVCCPSTSRTRYRPVSVEEISTKSVVERWQNREISNFEYLMILNTAAGRKMADSVFHPILPWVTDLRNSEGGWRDLKKSKFRLNKGDEQLDNTYKNSLIPHHITESLSEITYYIYMSRRTPMEILRKVVRKNFESKEYPNSLPRMYTWTPDECIPEFYSDASIFSSLNKEFNMDDLKLPPWCQDGHDFIRKHRELLESDNVSADLNYWIDLTFGVCLSGQAAITEKNVPLSSHSIESMKILNGNKQKSPGFNQLFSHRHPQRFVCSTNSEMDHVEIVERRDIADLSELRGSSSLTNEGVLCFEVQPPLSVQAYSSNDSSEVNSVVVESSQPTSCAAVSTKRGEKGGKGTGIRPFNSSASSEILKNTGHRHNSLTTSGNKMKEWWNNLSNRTDDEYDSRCATAATASVSECSSSDSVSLSTSTTSGNATGTTNTTGGSASRKKNKALSTVVSIDSPVCMDGSLSSPKSLKSSGKKSIFSEEQDVQLLKMNPRVRIVNAYPDQGVDENTVKRRILAHTDYEHMQTFLRTCRTRVDPCYGKKNTHGDHQYSNIFAMGCMFYEIYNLQPLFCTTSVHKYFEAYERFTVDEKRLPKDFDPVVFVPQLAKLPYDIRMLTSACIHPNQTLRCCSKRLLQSCETLFPPSFRVLHAYLVQYHKSNNVAVRLKQTEVHQSAIMALNGREFEVVYPHLLSLLKDKDRYIAESIKLREELGEVVLSTYEDVSENDSSGFLKQCLASGSVIKQIRQCFSMDSFMTFFFPILCTWITDYLYSLRRSVAHALEHVFLGQEPCGSVFMCTKVLPRLVHIMCNETRKGTISDRVGSFSPNRKHLTDQLLQFVTKIAVQYGEYAITCTILAPILTVVRDLTVKLSQCIMESEHETSTSTSTTELQSTVMDNVMHSLTNYLKMINEFVPVLSERTIQSDLLGSGYTRSSVSSSSSPSNGVYSNNGADSSAALCSIPALFRVVISALVEKCSETCIDGNHSTAKMENKVIQVCASYQEVLLNATKKLTYDVSKELISPVLHQYIEYLLRYSTLRKGGGTESNSIRISMFSNVYFDLLEVFQEQQLEIFLPILKKEHSKVLFYLNHSAKDMIERDGNAYSDTSDTTMASDEDSVSKLDTFSISEQIVTEEKTNMPPWLFGRGAYTIEEICDIPTVVFKTAQIEHLNDVNSSTEKTRMYPHLDAAQQHLILSSCKKAKRKSKIRKPLRLLSTAIPPNVTAMSSIPISPSSSMSSSHTHRTKSLSHRSSHLLWQYGSMALTADRDEDRNWNIDNSCTGVSIVDSIQGHSSAIEVLSSSEYSYESSRETLWRSSEDIFCSGSKLGTVRIWSLPNSTGTYHAPMSISANRVHKHPILAIHAPSHRSRTKDLVYSIDRSTLNAMDTCSGASVVQFFSKTKNPFTSINTCSTSLDLLRSSVMVSTMSSIQTVDVRDGLHVASDWKISNDVPHNRSTQGGGGSTSSCITCITCVESKSWVISGSGNGLITILDNRTGEIVTKWYGHTCAVLKMYSYSADHILTISKDQTAIVWNLRPANYVFPSPVAWLTIQGITDTLCSSNSIVLESGGPTLAHNFLLITSQTKLFLTILPKDPSQLPAGTVLVPKQISSIQEGSHTKNSTAPIGKLPIRHSKLHYHSVTVLKQRKLILLGSEDGFINACI